MDEMELAQTTHLSDIIEPQIGFHSIGGYVMNKSEKIYYKHKKIHRDLQKTYFRYKKCTNSLKYYLYEGIKRTYILCYKSTYYFSLIPLKLYDVLYGTEFSDIEKPMDDDGRFEYYPSPVFLFPFLRKYIREYMRSGIGHSVLDIGCGKGLLLLFFSSLSFDRVSGIEYDEKLYRLAITNLRHISKTVKVYLTDALDFTMYKDYDTFYLYNPFDERILEKCIRQLISSLELRPRKITVIYCNPVYGDCLKKNGFKEEGHFYMTTIFVYHKNV